MADINFDINEDPDAFLRSVRVSPEKYDLSASGSLPADLEYTAGINPRDRTAIVSASKEFGPANVTASIKRDMLNKENTSKIRGDMGNAYVEAENNPYSRELRGGYQTDLMGGKLRAGVNRSSPFGGKPEYSGNINYEKRFIHGGSVNHGLASLGRNGDSMLVHMNPKEVMGLQQLAMAHGKSMSINPQTGYPEAFNLTSLLPTAAAILGNIAFPGVGGAVAGGLTGALLSKGNPLADGMMGAFAGWGASGVTDALKGMGDTAQAEAMKQISSQAATDAAPAYTQSLNQEIANRAADTSRISNQNAVDFFSREANAVPYQPINVSEAAQNPFYQGEPVVPGQPMPQATPYPTYAQTPEQIAGISKAKAIDELTAKATVPEGGLNAGIRQLGKGQGWKDLVTKGGGLGLFAAASPILSELMKPKAAPVPAANPAQFYNADFTQTVNPNRGPNQPYFSEQKFTGGYSPTFRGAAGGEVPSADYYTNLLGGVQQQQIPSVDIRPYLDSMKYQPAPQQTQVNTPAGIPTLDAAGGRYVFNPITKQYEYIPAAPAVDQNQGIRNVATGEGGMGPSEAPGFSGPGNYGNSQYGGLGYDLNSPISQDLGNMYSGAAMAEAQAQADAEAAINAAGMVGAEFANAGVSDGGPSSSGGYEAAPGGAGQDATGGGYGGDGAGSEAGVAAGGSIRSRYAQGGIAGIQTYAAGGRLLRGPGDGMSDSIPAVIQGAKPQRAALADGEFVIPADVVSHLGNGSTEAGSKHLYKMMDRIRKARTGNPKQGKQINANKFLPA